MPIYSFLNVRLREKLLLHVYAFTLEESFVFSTSYNHPHQTKYMGKEPFFGSREVMRSEKKGQNVRKKEKKKKED